MDVPVKHRYVSSLRWALLRWGDIPYSRDETLVYLRRLRVVQTPAFAVYLHFIYKPDDDADPHDHPMNFWSLILRGGYVEEVYETSRQTRTKRLVGTRRWRRGSIHRMGTGLAHRISRLDQRTVTLVLAGPKRQEWGFWTGSGWVPWREYFRSANQVDEHS